jgi:hypothetical protein
MEIRIKTAQEFHDAHVTIEIVAENQTEVADVATALAQSRGVNVPSLRAKIVDLERELEAYRKAHHCTDSCRPNQHVAFTGRQRVQELERKLAEALPDLTSPGGGLSFDRRDVAQHLAANLAQRGLMLSRAQGTEDNRWKRELESLETELARRTGERDGREAARADLETKLFDAQSDLRGWQDTAERQSANILNLQGRLAFRALQVSKVKELVSNRDAMDAAGNRDAERLCRVLAEITSVVIKNEATSSEQLDTQ